MENKIVTGRFNSEVFWVRDCYVQLPNITNRKLELVVENMEELLCPFCSSKKDVLFTKNKVNSQFKDFISLYGINFTNITSEQELEKFSGYNLDVFASIPIYKNYATSYNLKYLYPPMEIIQKINSKKYSTELGHYIGVNNYGKIVTSISQLLEVVNTYLKDKRQFVIKEEFGVSGKGNYIIHNEKEWTRLLKHIISQIDKGKNMCFILEPFFDVKLDFSCQIRIESDGSIDFLSVQVIHNHKLTYSGSVNATSEFKVFLEKNQYFCTMSEVCKKMFENGYYGDICVDSAITMNGHIIPIIEINARKSMSLIKYQYDQIMRERGYMHSFSCMKPMEIRYKSDMKFENLISKLRSKKILLNANEGGCIPVSCNTLFCSRQKEKIFSKGRIYFYLIADTLEEIQQLEIQAQLVLEGKDI